MLDAQLNINLFDAIVFSVLFISALISLFRGFIREFLSLATWLGAGMVTLALADNVAAFLRNFIDSDMGAVIIGTMGTYFLVLLSIGSLSRLLVRYIKDGTEVGWVDNVMGLFFGVFKGGLVVVLGFILMTLIFKKDGYPEWVQTASTLPAVQGASIKVVRMLPEYLGNISSLDDNKAEGLEEEENPQMQSLQGRLLPERAKDAEQRQKDASALEQLILDVTKPQDTDNTELYYEQ